MQRIRQFILTSRHAGYIVGSLFAVVFLLGMALAVYVGTHLDADPVYSYEKCQEDEVLVPVEYGHSTFRKGDDGKLHGTGPEKYVYVCVTLDDFADPASIDRLDAIVAARHHAKPAAILTNSK